VGKDFKESGNNDAKMVFGVDIMALFFNSKTGTDLFYDRLRLSKLSTGLYHNGKAIPMGV